MQAVSRLTAFQVLEPFRQPPSVPLKHLRSHLRRAKENRSKKEHSIASMAGLPM